MRNSLIVSIGLRHLHGIAPRRGYIVKQPRSAVILGRRSGVERSGRSFAAPETASRIQSIPSLWFDCRNNTTRLNCQLFFADWLRVREC
jgi:hypothetical protein